MEKRKFTRRDFLRLSAGATAGAILAACKPAAPAPPPAKEEEKPAEKKVEVKPAKPAEPVKVTFMNTGGEKDQQMSKEALDVASEQKALQDGNIVVEWQPDPGGGWEKIMSMFAAGEAYDVQRIDDDRVAELAMANKVHQLDCWMEAYDMEVDDYYPLFWTTINLAGYQWCMNPACGADVVYYNIDLFKEAGVDLPPTSWKDTWEWDEFVDLCGKLSKKDAQGKPIQYALGFPTNVSTPIAYGAGGTFMDEEQTKCTMTAPEVEAALEEFVKLTVMGGPEYFVPQGLDRTELFNAGKLAMNWESMGFQGNISKDINWDICPWPKTPKYAYTENYDRTFVIAKTAPYPEAAFVALKTLCEQPAIDVFARYKFGVPYLKASAEGPVFLEGLPEHKNIWIETMGTIDGRPVDVPTPRGPAEEFKVTFVHENFGAVLAGDMSTKEFLEWGCTRSDQALKENNWRAGMMGEKLEEAGSITCLGTKMWPETPWP